MIASMRPFDELSLVHYGPRSGATMASRFTRYVARVRRKVPDPAERGSGSPHARAPTARKSRIRRAASARFSELVA